MRGITGVAFMITMALAVSGCGGSRSALSPQLPQPPQPPSPSGASIAISPTSAAAGSSDLILTITGSNFDGAGVIRSRAVWSANGVITPLSTTFVSSSQLTAVIPAALLNKPVTAQVFVQLWDNIESVANATYGPVNFTVTIAGSAVTVISPTVVTLGPQGTQQFEVALDGKTADAAWAIEEGANGGSITSTGLYTVPAHLGTFHVIATPVANPSKSAAATVTAVASGFTITGSMSKPRSGHTATLLANGKVLIVGGANGPDTTAELFDPATATFLPTGRMTTPRSGATATLLANGKVLIAGGFGLGVSSLPRLNTAELFDPITGTFAATGSMAVPRVLHTSTLLNDGRVLIAGGTDSSGGGGAAVPSAELYDPSIGAFTLTGSMLTDRAQHATTLLPSGEVLIVGGWNGHAADAADDPPWDPLFSELFDPSSGSFKASGSMSATRIGPAAIRLASGKVLILGGIPNPQNLHITLSNPAYGELYDPGAQIFSALGNLTMSRQGFTATLLNSGSVLLAGGKDLGSTVNTVELLDSSSGSLTPTGQLVTGRSGHTATLLKDGRVLVAGGTDSKGNAVATAELYK